MPELSKSQIKNAKRRCRDKAKKMIDAPRKGGLGCDHFGLGCDHFLPFFWRLERVNHQPSWDKDTRTPRDAKNEDDIKNKQHARTSAINNHLLIKLHHFFYIK
jgi:hypothetical protein